MFWATSLLALDVNGINYISLSQYAKMTGMKYKTLVRGKKMSVFSQYQNLSFEVNSRVARVGGYALNLGHPIVANKGMLYLSKRDVYKTLFPVLYPSQLKNPRVPFHVVIDAGHGGRDNGAENKSFGVKEKNVNLDIALRLGNALRQMGYKVSFTRTKDTFIELEHRPVIANRRGADLFISIHSNAATNRSVSGVETYALTPVWLPSSSSTKLRKSDTESFAGNNVDGWSQLLSFNIQRSLVDSTDSDDRGARRARFAVLRTATMPSCLVEVGFLSNRAECSKLINKSYRQNVANAIARGVARYASIVRRCKK
ncbi:MAG: N-acetylmuramoyl-L-alanine amidase [Verrucomicrobiaceae bacterium]|nr:N-acetylmuramoyl-L-alanine amidase [Verrucomicrobiaceae bacterium]